MDTIRRIVDLLGAIRTFSEVSGRAPHRASVCCGALRAHCPIAAYDRAPAATADAAISSTATNG
ncbi:hypothetical protein OG246_08710 [Streptomyces sp. NBC_00620]|nr:hypothetical protein [Streptomyces sp. NBC_00620]MCX4972991.1 hypothetical protein [Streptomyces sp. NBC_00620]